MNVKFLMKFYINWGVAGDVFRVYSKQVEKSYT